MPEYLSKKEISAYYNGTWNDITAYVVTDIVGEIGMYDNAPDNRLASTGNIRFSLDNISGTFTPGTYIQKGTPILVVNWYNGMRKTVFLGRIDTAVPDVGTWGNQRTHVEALDWMSYANSQPIRAKPAQTNVTIDTAVTALLSDISISPQFTDYSTGTQTFLAALDASSNGASYYSELNNLVMSEFSYIYLKNGGRTLRVEANNTRTGLKQLLSGTYTDSIDTGFALNDAGSGFLLGDTGGKLIVDAASSAHFDYTFNNSFVGNERGLDIVHGKNVLNDIPITVYPRAFGSSGTHLFELNIASSSKPVFIESLSSYTLNGNYTEPTSLGSVAGAGVETPVATTDYTFNAAADGTSTDLTANLSIVFTKGANGFKAVITNTGAHGYLTKFIVRGVPIKKNNSIFFIAEDTTTSKPAFGTQSLPIRQPYQQNTNQAVIEATKILDDEKNPRNVVMSAKFNTLASTNNMAGWMILDVGDMVYIKNNKPAVDGYYYVQGIRYKIYLSGDVDYELILKETYSIYKGLKMAGIRFSGFNASGNAILFGNPPQLTNLAQKTLSAWIYMRSGPSSSPIMAKSSSSRGWAWWLQQPGFTGKMMFSQDFDSGADGQWRLNSDVLSGLANRWIHIAMTYNDSSVANNPYFFITGTKYDESTYTEISTPVGTVVDDTDATFLIGNHMYPGENLARNLNAYLKDVRIYNRILTDAEILTLSGNENNFTILAGESDGLVFQAALLKDNDYTTYLNTALPVGFYVIDNVSGIRGRVTYDTSSANNQMKVVDPTSANGSLP